jgi:hypothetical protein
MKRFWGHAFAVTGALAIAVELIPACAHNDSSIFINGVLAPSVSGSSNGQACTYTADPTQMHITTGLLDVAVLRSYDAVVLVGNQLIARASPEQGRTETNRVVIQGAIISVTDASGASLHDPFTRSAAATVDPSQGTQPGYTAIGVELLDHGIIDGIANSLSIRGDPVRSLIHVKMFGNTLGGDHVETNDFQFPVDLCRGCLVLFDAVSPSTGTCAPAAASGSSSTKFTPCRLGQDQPFSCSYCYTQPECIPPPGSIFPSTDGGSTDAGGGG